MNEYNQERFKKEAETKDLLYFLESYNHATGNEVRLFKDSERPDFICEYSNGAKIGIELTMITRHPKTRQWDKIVEKKEFMNSEETIELIQLQAVEKDEKREEKDWVFSEKTILVIQLKDISLSVLDPFLRAENLPDLYTTGFKEIWLGDYCDVDAYSSINTFCLMPQESFGFYQRSNTNQKPFG